MLTTFLAHGSVPINRRMLPSSDFAPPLPIRTCVVANGVKVSAATEHGPVAKHHDATSFRINSVLHDRLNQVQPVRDHGWCYRVSV
jgi:hypothetical protein